MLYHLVPIAIWLLALGGSVLPLVLITYNPSFVPDYYWGFLVAAIVLLCMWILARLERHASSVEECFLVAVLLGIASCWLPTIIVLGIPALLYLQFRNLLQFRGIMAFLLGYALVAVWLVVGCQLSLIHYQFSLSHNTLGWIPTGCFLVAWISSTIARRILRVR